MTEFGMFIWKIQSMPPALALVDICKQYHITRLAIKVLEGAEPFNVPNGDKPLMDYIAILSAAGITVEGWGYHYPDNPGGQGDAIEERREKLGFRTYHVDIEGEWKQPFGMPAKIKLLLSKPKINNFEMLICSYRFPSQHPQMPWDAAMNHETIDGASPQVYWALRHNPDEQLLQTFTEYAKWKKPVFPLGSMFGATFTVKDNNGEDIRVYWEATPDEIHTFVRWCRIHNVPRMYFWSMDYVLSKKRFDFLAAANWEEPPVIPPDPEPEPDEINPVGSFTVKSGFRNLRNKPMGDVIGKAINGSVLPFTEKLDEWYLVNAWVWKSDNE